MTTPDPFLWKKDGVGMAVDTKASGMIAHEVMYEDDVTHIKEDPLFLGAAIPHRRFFILFIVATVMLMGLIGRAFWMQVVSGDGFKAQADRNRLRVEVAPSRRGVIRDRNGTILADNIPSFDVQAIERELPSATSDREELLAKVGRIIGMQVTDIENIFASSTDPDATLVLKRDLPYDRALALKIATADDPAIEVAVGSKRRYPLSPQIESLSHVLGYVSGITQEELDKRVADGYSPIDTIGKTGIESTYESILRGTPGEQTFEVDSRHRVTGTVGEKLAVDGQDVVLAIDADIQKAAETSLQKELATLKMRRGAVVAMDPNDGSVLAIVSLPAYDNNMFSGTVSSTLYSALVNDPDHPLLPRAWAGMYPSGSTAKPMIATAALAEGVITSNTTVISTGGLKVGPWFFPDWKAGGHGVTNVRRALAWSVNTFFYYVGGGYERFVGLGVDRLTAWMRKFGLGQRTGIDVPGEASGFVPSQDWKLKTKGERWFIGDTYNLSIGQGDLLVTPLQIASYTSTIANGGYAVVPHIALTMGAGTDAKPVQTVKASTPIADPSVIETVRLGMRDTVIYGSGRALSSLPFPVAGKTGTAQWRSDKNNHSWFTAFAPYDHPQIVVTVLIEEGVEGSVTAVPVARSVLEAWYAKQKH